MGTTALPLHPHLTHPHTGAPLRAIWVSAKTGRTYWPILGASPDDDGADDGDGGQGDDGDGGSGKDHGYPANTPVDQMTVEQRVAYWQHHAQKHERMLRAERKALGGIRPEELQTLREKAERTDQLEYDLGTDSEKAVADAVKKATDETEAKYQPKLVETAFKIAIGDRKTAVEVNEFLADLNLARFLDDDGNVDTTKVLARVNEFAPATGTTSDGRKGPTITRHGSGNGTTGDGKKGESGRELYDRLNRKKASAGASA